MFVVLSFLLNCRHRNLILVFFCAQFDDHTLLTDAVALGRIDIVRLFVARPDVDVSSIKPVTQAEKHAAGLIRIFSFFGRVNNDMCHFLLQLGEGRPSPERKQCENLVKEARAVRRAQGDVKTETNKEKRRSWWEAFGLV